MKIDRNRKSIRTDKWDAHIVSKRDFVHSDFSVSTERERFHSVYAGFYTEGWSYRGSMGTAKKLWRASPNGYNIDAHSVGSSQE